MYPHKPDKTYHIKAWTIRVYTDEHIATCHRRNSITVVISDSTEQITLLPEYVLDFLFKQGFLVEWRETQIRKHVTKLTDLVTKISEIGKKRKAVIDAEG